MSAPSPTRREALARGLSAGGALAVSAAGLTFAARALAQTDVNALVLRAAEIEQDARVAYETLAKGDLLDDEVAAAAEAFAFQEREHVEALAAALADLGGAEPPPPPKPGKVKGLDEVDSQDEALGLAIDLENKLLRAYGEIVAASTEPALLKTVTEIALNAAQHLAVLRQQLGDPPLPEALETGKP